MFEGRVPIPRDVADDAVMKDAGLWQLYSYLVLMANFQDKEFAHGGEIMFIRAGCHKTGRQKLAERLDVPESTVRGRLERLTKMGYIKQHKTTKYTVICIINYSRYTFDGQPKDNKETSTKQQLDTNNNDKKEKNNNNSDSSLKRKEAAITLIKERSHLWARELSAEFDATPAQAETKMKEAMDWIDEQDNFNSNGKNVVWKFMQKTYDKRTQNDALENPIQPHKEGLLRIAATKNKFAVGKGKEIEQSPFNSPNVSRSIGRL